MTNGRTPFAAVVGAGPAGLMAAERLAAAGARVVVFERMPSVGRKLLLAGRGGLNLTHSEGTDAFLARYGARQADLEPAIRAFPPEALIEWCEALGIETFAGTSGRIFPKTMKSSPLLRAWLRRLGEAGVEIRTRWRWTGFEGDALAFEAPDGPAQVKVDATVLALGGASWPRLGSDGTWTGALTTEGVEVAPLLPANCGFVTRWSSFFAERFAGEPIKRAALDFEGARVRGEAMVTTDGIEGGLIYALSAPLREAIVRDGAACPTIDLRPDIEVDALAKRLAAPRAGRSLSTHLRKTAGLAPVAIALLREAGQPPEGPEALARAIKAAPLALVAPKSIDRAISSAGGVRFSSLDETLMARSRPGLFVAGEMLDWEAPTGGYLLQGSFATGAAAAQGAVRWLGLGLVGDA